MKRDSAKAPPFQWPDSKIQSIGVDWLTCTQYRALGLKMLQAEIERVIYKEKREGNDETTWKGQGYYGRKSGGAVYGVRDDTYLAILSSDCARENWRSVAQWATNCSRLDLQVTFELKQRDTSLFDRLETHFCSLPPRRGRPLGVCRVRDNRGGNTLYIGSRSSDWYMRIYDKGVESGLCEGGWLVRVEIERKRTLAKRVLAQLMESADAEATIFDLVCSDLEKQSVQVSFLYNSLLEVARVDSISDSQRRLAYLTSSVRPIIEKLINAGFGDRAMEILFHNGSVGGSFP